MNSPQARAPAESAPTILLMEAACEPFRAAGRFAYYFARGKLARDPVFQAILQRGLLAGCPRILDLGCGQGLLTAWLEAAVQVYEAGHFPPDWQAPPRPLSVRGIELMNKDVERARRALGPRCGVSQGDIRTAEFGTVDAVVILDVLHYMSPSDQRQVLERVRGVLPLRGRLLLRVGDAGAGLRFHVSQWVDKLVWLCRGHALIPQHCRTAAQWRALLQECRFTVETAPMSQGTPFANVLLIASACA